MMSGKGWALATNGKHSSQSDIIFINL